MMKPEYKFLANRFLPVAALLLSVTGAVGTTGGIGMTGAAQAASNLPLSLPGPARRPVVNDPQIAALTQKNQKYPTYAGYRKLAELYLARGLYAEAAQAYRSEAAMYRQKGLLDAAIIEETRAARYETQVRFFLNRALNAQEMNALDTRARLEPPMGAYIGAFIDRDDQLKQTWQDENFQTHRRPQEFVKMVGKPHATYFMYLKYGSKFPRKWLEDCKAAGAIPHIAWEPQNLNDVKNDKYLQEFARGCGQLNWPIFIRYASEMNGSWTRYHGNPKLYRDKFRLVHSVLRQYAPQTAMIWCVNAVPRENIQQYYPGDDGCDWVGINVYSVPFYDNNPKNPAFLDSPLSLIEPIYNLYKDRKPIAICEYAASQMAAVDKVPRTDFAIQKMSLLYSGLPALYPRVKMVNWFNMNTMRHAVPGRQLNNYSLTENKAMLQAYRDLIAAPYYLGATLGNAGTTALPTTLPRPVALGQVVNRGRASFDLWVRSYVARPKVYLEINKKIVYAGRRAGGHNIELDLSSVPSGMQPVRVYVFDDNNRFVATSAITVNVARSGQFRDATQETPAVITEPIPVTGLVQRYEVDATGLVTALVLEANGKEETLYFEANRAQSLFRDFPPGAELSAWVLPRAGSQERQWNLAGIGEEAPASPAPQATDTTQREPTLLQGAPVQEARGKLTNVVANEHGEILALVLDDKTLIYLPRELRHIAPSEIGSDGAPALSKNGDVLASGQVGTLPDGALSTFITQLVATHVTVNGRDISASGLPLMPPQRAAEIFGKSRAALTPYQPPLPPGNLKMRGGSGDDLPNTTDLPLRLNANASPW